VGCANGWVGGTVVATVAGAQADKIIAASVNTAKIFQRRVVCIFIISSVIFIVLDGAVFRKKLLEQFD